MANQAGSSTWMQNMAQCEYFKSPKSPKFLLKMCQILFSFLQACSWQVRRRFFCKNHQADRCLLWYYGKVAASVNLSKHVHTLEIFTQLKFSHPHLGRAWRIGETREWGLDWGQKSSSWFEVLSKSNRAFSLLYFCPSTAWVEITDVHHRW